VFPYPWNDENSLAVYRDIGIQLGLARALDASAFPDATADDKELARRVREVGLKASRPDNQIGQAGFDVYRGYFADLPKPDLPVEMYLKHSNFAVLILLILKQAVYHTIRARIHTDQNATIIISVVKSSKEIVFECVVKNPKVKDDDAGQQSKDSAELRELAERLSDLPDHPARYAVEGPAFNEEEDCWLTTTRIHATVLA
jgi:hypothetical protein